MTLSVLPPTKQPLTRTADADAVLRELQAAARIRAAAWHQAELKRTCADAKRMFAAAGMTGIASTVIERAVAVATNNTTLLSYCRAAIAEAQARKTARNTRRVILMEQPDYQESWIGEPDQQIVPLKFILNGTPEQNGNDVAALTITASMIDGVSEFHIMNITSGEFTTDAAAMRSLPGLYRVAVWSKYGADIYGALAAHLGKHYTVVAY